MGDPPWIDGAGRLSGIASCECPSESIFSRIAGLPGDGWSAVSLIFWDTCPDNASHHQRGLIQGRNADVAELADALDSGSSARKGVEVQVLSSAPRFLRDLRDVGVSPVSFADPEIRFWGHFGDTIGNTLHLSRWFFPLTTAENPTMASLEQRNGTYRVVFRHGGQKYSRSLKTQNKRAAELSLAQLEDNLRRVELGTLTIAADADVPSVLLSSGKATNRIVAPKRYLLGKILDDYVDSIPDDAIESKTRDMIRIHTKHLKRLLGVRTAPVSMTLEKLQQYVNERSQEPGIRGRRISPVTVRKELTTLHAAWTWAIESGMVSNPLPAKRRLRYGKEDEKLPFKTWTEIERIIKRGELSESEQRDYWDCLYLSQDQVAELLDDIAALDREPFVYPMIATAAYTGARRSELLRSRLEDVDLDVNQLVIRERKRVRGKRSSRSMPISAALRTILEPWLDNHPGGPFTFTSDGQAISRDRAHCHFENTLAGTKWSVLRGWHVLRHSFISNCASKGIDQRIIDDWVGHQTDDMRRRYRHLFQNIQHQAMAAVFG